MIQAKANGTCFFRACVGRQIRPGQGLRRDSSTACTSRSGVGYVEPPSTLHSLVVGHRFGALKSWRSLWKTGQKRVTTLPEPRMEDLVALMSKAATRVARSQTKFTEVNVQAINNEDVPTTSTRGERALFFCSRDRKLV